MGGELPEKPSRFSDLVLAAVSSPAPLSLLALASSGSPAQVRRGHAACVVSQSPGLPPASRRVLPRVLEKVWVHSKRALLPADSPRCSDTYLVFCPLIYLPRKLHLSVPGTLN